MTKKYDIEFKKQLVHAYMQGTSYPQLEREYGVAKSTISGWVKKYREECRYTSKSQSDNLIIHTQRRSIILIRKLPNWRRRTFS